MIRSFLWVTLGLTLVFLVALAVTPAVLGGSKTVAIGGVALTCAGLVSLWRLQRSDWTRLGLAFAAVALAFAYLAVDDPAIRRPLSIETIAPNVAGAEQSYDVFMRYGKRHPLGMNFKFQPSSQLYQGQGTWRPKDPQWSAWLAKNRVELEDNWVKLAPVLAWWTELNTFATIGDLTPRDYDAEIPTFAPIRSLTQHACAIASLQALDGQGDAALETILPILEVSRKLEPSARTLVRFMIARVSQKMALETTRFILDHTPVSPDARARLAAALKVGRGPEAELQHLIAMEYTWAIDITMQPASPLLFSGDALDSHWLNEHRWIGRVAEPLRPFLFNSRRTINAYGELTAELQTLAVNRDFERIGRQDKEFFANQGRADFKNFAGTILLRRMIPAYQKIVESYWSTEDLRSALAAQVRA